MTVIDLRSRQPVQLSGVSAAAGPARVVDVCLDIHHGESAVVIGTHGSGKTSLLSLVLGLERPSAGRVRVFGHEPWSNDARPLLGHAPAHPTWPGALDVRRVLANATRLHHEDCDLDEIAERFLVREHLDRPVSALCRAEQRLVSLARAFVGRPRLLVLDEPTDGLDRSQRSRVWSLIRQAHTVGATVLVATRDLAEATVLGDRVIFLEAGQVVLDATRDQVRALVGASRVSFRHDQPSPPDHLLSAVRTSTEEGQVHVTTNDVAALLAELAQRQIDVRDVTVRSVSLDDARTVLPSRVPHQR